MDEEAVEAALQEIQLQKTRADLLDKEIEELRAAFLESLSKKEARQYERQEKKEAAEAESPEIIVE